MAALAYASALCVMGMAMAHGSGSWSMNGGAYQNQVPQYGANQYGWNQQPWGNQNGQVNPMTFFQNMMRTQQQQQGSNMGMGNGMGNMGMNQGMGMGNMGNGNTGMGSTGMGNTGMGQQNSMMSNLMMVLIANMLKPSQGMSQQGGRNTPEASTEDVNKMEDLMKWKMTMEMADMMMIYMDYKEKETAFTESMEALCWMVNNTYNAVKTRGYVLFKNTTDEWMDMKGKEMESWSEQEKSDYALNMLMTDPQTYSEIFVRFATWVCMTGEQFAKAVMKMEKMNMGDD
ncbi:uncharacterized protein LOC128243527 [Mya arenaria]|uniref:uncharacterized protein LOC128243527 n=1 Tax=Mya arenaria TaxID=6604 RepID=UPI0022E232CA|nr:uncharacterized protein LOC128243527 [Mya arenaria]XP_052817323.1 uncharacterized protein LOC128243527 [Mya arenaria]